MRVLLSETVQQNIAIEYGSVQRFLRAFIKTLQANPNRGFDVSRYVSESVEKGKRVLMHDTKTRVSCAAIKSWPFKATVNDSIVVILEAEEFYDLKTQIEAQLSNE